MKSSKVLYPNNLREEHDKVTKLVKIVENEANDRLIKQRLKELKKPFFISFPSIFTLGHLFSPTPPFTQPWTSLKN